VTPRMSHSLTARLVILFAAVVTGTMVLVSAYLYRALAVQSERRDDTELIGKVLQIRHLLSEAASVRDIETDPHPLRNAVLGHEGLLFLVVSADGRVLAQNVRPPSPLSQIKVVPTNREPSAADIRVWDSEQGRRRAIAAAAIVGERAADEVQIFLAREAAYRAASLTEFGWHLILSALAGALLAGLLGYMTVRNSLKPIGVIAAKAKEITTRKLDTRLALEEVPAELRELAADFNSMLDRLEDGIKRLSQFSADLAHDLRTPINTLMVETQVALSRPRSVEDYQALLAANDEEYERLSRLIETTLFLARAENAQLALHPQVVELGEKLEKITDYFSGVAEEARVSLRVGGEGTAYADPVLLERAVSNLISNAIRYSDSGTVIEVSAGEDGHHAFVCVANRGTGIPAAYVNRVFDRYFRGDATRAQADGSSGLGLAIVKAIMKLHEGSVELTTEVNGTTRFALKFRRPELST
jgi:two-component system, OmpR family, heavy metal sensor histidine kinase CusS